MGPFPPNPPRPLILSAPPPPPAVGARLPRLQPVPRQPPRGEKLQQNARVLRAALRGEGLAAPGEDTPIVPLVVGNPEAAVAAAEAALAEGVFAQAIRPPTVPDGTSRLRLAVMASHTKSELREAARTLAAAVPRVPAAPSAGIFDHLADAA